MKDDSIELPPLPEARIVSYQTDSTMRCMELRTHSNEDMRDYARAAIEADRKRRGAEVKAVVDDLRSHASMARWQAHSLSRLLDAVATQGAQKAATLTAAMSNLERMAMRLEDSADYIDTHAPQPAEPHPPHRDCMCAECAHSFEDYSAEPVGYILMESGKPVAFFDEIPAESHYDASAYIPVGVFGKPAEPRLDAPAQVGHTRFGEGVPWSTVIGAAQRYHAIENTPTKEQERMKKAAERLKAIQPAEPVDKSKNLQGSVVDKAEEMQGQPAEPVKMRPETDSEHIARDIREGRFPEKSDRKMVPAEPVKELSDADAKHVQDFINCDGLGAMIVGGSQYSAVVRALLDRYGNAAQPAPEPPRSD